VNPGEIHRQVIATLSLVLGKNAEDWMAEAVVKDLRARGLEIVDASGLRGTREPSPVRAVLDADSTGADRTRRAIPPRAWS